MNDFTSISETGDLNEQQTQALIDLDHNNRFLNNFVRVYTHVSALPVLRSTGGATQTLRIPTLFLDTVTAGANKHMVVGDSSPILGNEVPSGVNGYRWIIYAKMEINASSSANATQYMGVGINEFPSTPWTSLSVPALQVRYRSSDSKWEFMACVGDGATAQTTLVSVGASATGIVRLDWIPGTSATATVNGETLGPILPPNIPDFDALGRTSWMNLFVTSGTGGNMSADFGTVIVEAIPI